MTNHGRAAATTVRVIAATLSLVPFLTPMAAAGGTQPGLLGLIPGSGSWEKPAAPIRIEVQPMETLGPDRQRARIVVTPRMPGASLQVIVRAMQGLSIEKATPIEPGSPAAPSAAHPPAPAFALERGSATLTTGGDPGRSSALDLVVGSAARGTGRLLVEATLTLEDGTRQTAIALWAGETPEPPSSERHPGSRVVTTPDGRQILEIPSGRP